MLGTLSLLKPPQTSALNPDWISRILCPLPLHARGEGLSLFREFDGKGCCDPDRRVVSIRVLRN